MRFSLSRNTSTIGLVAMIFLLVAFGLYSETSQSKTTQADLLQLIEERETVIGREAEQTYAEKLIDTCQHLEHADIIYRCYVEHDVFRGASTEESILACQKLEYVDWISRCYGEVEGLDNVPPAKMIVACQSLEFADWIHQCYARYKVFKSASVEQVIAACEYLNADHWLQRCLKGGLVK